MSYSFDFIVYELPIILIKMTSWCSVKENEFHWKCVLWMSTMIVSWIR